MPKVSLAALAATAAFALGVAGCNAQPQGSAKAETAADKAFGAKVHAYLLAHPEVIEEAVQKLQADQEALKSASASVQIQQNRQALEHDARDGVAGNPKGSVTLVEFYDYRCPYCKAAQPELQRLLAKHTNVRLVLKEFPILDVEDNTHISEDASRAAIAAMTQGKYFKVHDDLLAEKHLDEDAIARILKGDGVDITKDQALAKSDAVSQQIADTHKIARAIGVDGTPGFVIGDQMIAGARMDDIEAAITAQSGKAHAN
jgi:protein-disulfide isomerase